MKILVVNVNASENGIILNTEAIPNIGFSVDVFNMMPRPKVTAVLMWPSKKTLESLSLKGFELFNIDAIVTCA